MHRPRTLEGMKAALSAFMTEEGKAKGLELRTRRTDVFISPYAKCGTTWMQQIVHGLRTGGDMQFDEITAVTPWIEMAHDLGMPLDPQRGDFRVFKSHLTWEEIPKGGRYVIVVRDPIDAMISLFNFLEGWFFEAGKIDLSEFAQYYLDERDGNDYWTHLMSWWAVKDCSDVLVLCYEDMKADLGFAVKQVAAFLDIRDPETLEIAEVQARFDFMKAHETQFDDHLTRACRDAACGLPHGSVASKVNQGKVGSGKVQLSDAALEAFDARWMQTMGLQFGVEDYAALRSQLAP